eukprot:IDg22069t1
MLVDRKDISQEVAVQSENETTSSFTLHDEILKYKTNSSKPQQGKPKCRREHGACAPKYSRTLAQRRCTVNDEQESQVKIVSKPRMSTEPHSREFKVKQMMKKRTNLGAVRCYFDYSKTTTQ